LVAFWPGRTLVPKAFLEAEIRAAAVAGEAAVEVVEAGAVVDAVAVPRRAAARRRRRLRQSPPRRLTSWAW
jgi:hypothetical protein